MGTNGWECEKRFKIHYHDNLEPELDQAGKYIGYQDRLLIGIFIMIDAYQGLALLATLKTIARFQQFESKDFAKYYLIGTLLSFVLGITFSLFIKFFYSYRFILLEIGCETCLNCICRLPYRKRRRSHSGFLTYKSKFLIPTIAVIINSEVKQHGTKRSTHERYAGD